MASKRKWRAESDLGISTFPSKTAVYRHVNAWRKAYRANDKTVAGITVWVDERDGRGWQLYERIDFASEVPDAG